MEISVWYNPATNELGLFDWKTLTTLNSKHKAELVVCRKDSKLTWIFVGML